MHIFIYVYIEWSDTEKIFVTFQVNYAEDINTYSDLRWYFDIYVIISIDANSVCTYTFYQYYNRFHENQWITLNTCINTIIKLKCNM